MKTNTAAYSSFALARPNQRLLDHLLGVGERTRQLCPAVADWAQVIGLLHDYGKYRPEWIAGMHEIARTGESSRKLPHHAAEGGSYLVRSLPREQTKVWVLAILIASHHSGLPDVKPGLQKLRSQVLDDADWGMDEVYVVALAERLGALNYAELDTWLPLNDYRMAQRLRFLFGALVAADRQDAAESDGWKPLPGATMAELAGRLADWYGEEFGEPQCHDDLDGLTLNQLRGDFYWECREAGRRLEPGWLSVRGPCGISKTWSVMQLALEHAAQWQKRKVIYCVPWTAILEQSYAQYRERLGSEAVLGHWSTLVDPKTEDPEQLRNSRQWWDTPVVATTMVQLFDVLLGAKARTAQRMPSLQDAVIVLDEVQGLPTELLTTCIAVLDQLVQDHGASIVLSTATMPEYGPLGIAPVEALPEQKVMGYFARTQRVEYLWRAEPLAWADIAAEILQEPSPSTLIVMNTVAACEDAGRLMEQELDGYLVFRYTASMPPAHREAVLAKIKSAVQATKDGGPRVVICATSAIETGVDLDCERGYRESAGLESIVQFAGRINRNMTVAVCPVHIFETAKSYTLPPGMKQRIEKTSQAMELGTNLQSPEVLTSYSRLLVQDAISAKQSQDIYDYLAGLEKLEWDTVSREWQMISPTTSVLVDPRLWGAEAAVVAAFDEALGKHNFRVLQRHCVGLYRGKYKKAEQAGCVAKGAIDGLMQWVGDYDGGVVLG